MAIVGVDESGRGPLAGPVVAACVLLGDVVPVGLNDSKQLTALKREQLFYEIMANAKAVGIGVVDAAVIDRLNIHNASLLAMRLAILQVQEKHQISLALIDGMHKVKDLLIEQKAVIDGDALLEPIMAASIIAKVHRDRLMLDFDKSFPKYGFKSHKGYCTQMHLQALMNHGPCPIHRKTFAPVKNL